MSSQKPFVHLHLHTAFSLLDGACPVKKLMDAVVEKEMPAVAITDHGVMYGCIDFYKAAHEKGIKPIIGCEFYITPNSRHDRRIEGQKVKNHHLVLLAKDRVGYHNMVRLCSAAHLEGFYYKPRIDMEILAQHHEGLIGLSACLNGEVTARLAEEDLAGAITKANQYGDILGHENFYIEIQDHGIPEQRVANRHMAELSQQTGFPLVATNDVHYLKKSDSAAHEVLLCMQTQTVLSDPKHMRYRTDEFYLKSREEMDLLFRDYPGAVDITNEIADRCNVEFEFGKLHFPSYDATEGLSHRDYLIKLGHEGIARLYDVPEPAHPATESEQAIMDRFDHEMRVIEKTGFVNYFLVVWDFMNYSRRHDIPVGPGRGSGGGSIVAYVLGITTIDPLRYELIFERFLNPERVSPPDFDIDFCQARRGEVIEYVKDKYGRDSVAQIITFGSLGAKSVIRDVGRVLEIPYSRCDQLSKMIPEDPKMTLQKALDENPDFKRAYQKDEDCKRILDYGFVLEGLYRNAGTHAAGVVIGEKPLVEIIPLARDKDKEPVTQYTMEPLGEIGLLKMDFLGLKTLTVLKEACELIKVIHNVVIDLEEIPFDDAPAYALLNRGDTVGVFQLESGGMRDLIRRIGIDRIEDLIAMIALYRPGPMNMLPDYIERKSGRAKIKYDHPLLEPILKETYGVMVYQEQVQRAANILAGYSLGEADILRRAMGKKKQSVMEEQRQKFVAGCKTANNIDAKKSGGIFDTMAKFAGYGFNKAHSAGYGIISYQTAYLKANYPAEFMAALISSEIGNFDKLPVFINEAIAMDLDVLPPDVNASGPRFVPAGTTIRFGLAGIKNVGTGASEAIVNERTANGPFSGMIDLCSRVDSSLLNKKALESLVRAGGMDCFGLHRARIFKGIDFASARAAATLRDKRSGQGNLFDMLATPEAAAAPEALPEADPWHESEVLAGERELLGIYMSGHPLTQYAPVLKRYQQATIEQLGSMDDHAQTRIGGIISTVTRRVTKASKESMAILLLEDLDGYTEVLVFPEAFQKFGVHIHEDAAVLVCGEVSRREEVPKMIASEIYPLADAPRYFATKLSIHLPASHMADRLPRVRDLVKTHPGDTPVIICLQFATGEKVFLDTDPTFKVLAEESLVHELQQELGEDSVYVATNPKPCLRETSGRNGRGRWNKNGR
ncbi:MAG: DNA polymerase III subunit alpha [Verrucomicrobia bacterium]|nr:DNA polymerase III subunit alpha [Verrucomicrobiota bacterium]MBT7701344.1 DNA polymerase III subunit alpha [Verrucomicrobiota bacterium]